MVWQPVSVSNSVPVLAINITMLFGGFATDGKYVLCVQNCPLVYQALPFKQILPPRCKLIVFGEAMFFINFNELLH